MQDLQLLHTNAHTFNGADHSVTKRSLYVLDFTKALMKEFDSTLTVLEENIQKRSNDDDDSEPSSKERSFRGKTETAVVQRKLNERH